MLYRKKLKIRPAVLMFTPNTNNGTYKGHNSAIFNFLMKSCIRTNTIIQHQWNFASLKQQEMRSESNPDFAVENGNYLRRKLKTYFSVEKVAR